MPILFNFHILIALVHPSLTLISIDGHLHSPLIHLVDVRLSPSFCLLHITPIIMLYSTHSAISMAHAHVLREDWKGLKMLSMKQLLGLSSRLCMMGAFCVTKMKHGQTVWFCRDKLALALLFWKDMIALLVPSKYYCFYVKWETIALNHSCLNIHAIIRYMIKIMLGSIPHQK